MGVSLLPTAWLAALVCLAGPALWQPRHASSTAHFLPPAPCATPLPLPRPSAPYALPPAPLHQAITYNNLGCLFKRRNMPQLALQYLQRALALEEGGGRPVQVQNSSSTHLNICAAYSALKRPKEVRVRGAGCKVQSANCWRGMLEG